MKKTIYLSLVLLLVTILLSMNVLATDTLTLLPASSSKLDNNTKINATVTLDDQVMNISYNCTFTILSASTANSSATQLGAAKIVNVTSNGSIQHILKYYNFSINVFEDANNYVLSASCTNGSTTLTASSTSLLMDKTIPTAPSFSSAASITTPQTHTFTTTVSDPKTTACTYTAIRGGAASSDYINYISGTPTYATTSCTFTKEFTQALKGDWIITMTASDGTNTTAGTQTFSNNIPTGGSATLPGTITPTPISTVGFWQSIKNFFAPLINFFKNLF